MGIGFGSFTSIHFIRTGDFSPYKWVAFIAGFFFLLSMFFLLLGFTLDMFSRIRINQDEMLYRIRVIEDSLKGRSDKTDSA